MLILVGPVSDPILSSKSSNVTDDSSEYECRFDSYLGNKNLNFLNFSIDFA
uniref:Uncharacterized protein n=1 Tax=Siphoviridae sp. ctHip2 TaxID=2827830 RepID=A0A8S5RWU7_9CAUD|nr:MAG TPA: hypothetical protein [Siphoviridae sp. ctHip2]